MRLTTLSTVLLGTVLLLQSPAAARQSKAEPLPTMQELTDLFDKQQWQPFLQKSSRILSLRGAVAQNYDRYEILMMRGEAQLNLKSVAAAGAAFKDAIDDTEDPLKRATARASMTLVRKSSAGQFTRKSPTSQPGDPKTFDLLDRSKRKAAFAALAEDELSVVAPKAKAAEKGTSLKPIADMFEAVEDLRTAELAGTGRTDRADALIAPLARRAAALSADEVKRQAERVSRIETSANKVIDYDVPDRSSGYDKSGNAKYKQTRYKKQGLIGTDQRDLKDAIEVCGKVESATKQLAEAFGEATGKPLLAVSEDARKCADRAKSVLNADYTQSSSDPAGLR